MTEQEATLQAVVGYISIPREEKIIVTRSLNKLPSEVTDSLSLETWHLSEEPETINLSCQNGNGLSINSRRNTFQNWNGLIRLQKLLVITICIILSSQ